LYREGEGIDHLNLQRGFGWRKNIKEGKVYSSSKRTVEKITNSKAIGAGKYEERDDILKNYG